MKWFQFLVVFFLAVVCIKCDETDEVTSSDELELNFYGLDDTDSSDTVVETEEQEVESTTTPIPTSGPWGGRPGRRGQHRHQGRHHGRHGHHGQTHSGRGNWSPEAKLNHICNSLQAESTSGDRMARKFQRKFSRLNEEQRASLQQTMAARKAAISNCCQMTGEERQQCAEEVRTARYERVCNGEETLCIWAELMGDSTKTASMSATSDRCCASTGQDRLTCFTEARSQYFRGSHGNHGSYRRYRHRDDNQP